MEGVLHKRGDVVKNWRPRFFVLQQGNLVYFKVPHRQVIHLVPPHLRALASSCALPSRPSIVPNIRI